jgi:hypothetical protein
MNFRVGDVVIVRNPSEILATLDSEGCFEALPFMPQMVKYCGKRFRVSKSAHKFCDTANATGARRLKNAVFLDEIRCDGQTYAGCEMECRIFWKEAWLKPADETAAFDDRSLCDPRTAELQSLALKNTTGVHADGERVYLCQATRMPAATEHLSLWDPRQYVKDVQSGNASAFQVFGALAFLVYDTVANAGLGIGSAMRFAYSTVQRLRRKWAYPSREGRLAKNARTPTVQLGLQPGDVVKVRTHEDILATVTEDLVNRGLSFHADMVPFCSSTFRVEKTLKRIIDEKTGKLRELKNPCIVLEGVPCGGRYTKPRLCPRGMAPYWREIWLERADPVAAAGGNGGEQRR